MHLCRLQDFLFQQIAERDRCHGMCGFAVQNAIADAAGTGSAEEIAAGAERGLESCCSGQAPTLRDLNLRWPVTQAAAEEHRVTETHQMRERKKRYLQPDAEFILTVANAGTSSQFSDGEVPFGPGGPNADQADNAAHFGGPSGQRRRGKFGDIRGRSMSNLFPV